MTATVTVSFFTSLSIDTLTRMSEFQMSHPAHLRKKIANSMRGTEFFACYRDRSGAVIALDKQGICVTV